MQPAVAICPRVSITGHGIQTPYLLDSSSEVTLIWQSYFEQHLLPQIKWVTGEKAAAHALFKLTVDNDGQLWIRMYTKLDITFLGLKVPNVVVLIIKDSNQVLGRKHQTKLPGIVRGNLIWLSYNVFVSKHGTSGFDSFNCPEGVNPLLFSHLNVYWHSDICEGHTLGVITKVVSHQPQQTEAPNTDVPPKKRLTKFY